MKKMLSVFKGHFFLTGQMIQNVHPLPLNAASLSSPTSVETTFLQLGHPRFS